MDRAVSPKTPSGSSSRSGKRSQTPEPTGPLPLPTRPPPRPRTTSMTRALTAPAHPPGDRRNVPAAQTDGYPRRSSVLGAHSPSRALARSRGSGRRVSDVERTSERVRGIGCVGPGVKVFRGGLRSASRAGTWRSARLQASGTRGRDGSLARSGCFALDRGGGLRVSSLMRGLGPACGYSARDPGGCVYESSGGQGIAVWRMWEYALKASEVGFSSDLRNC